LFKPRPRVLGNLFFFFFDFEDGPLVSSTAAQSVSVPNAGSMLLKSDAPEIPLAGVLTAEDEFVLGPWDIPVWESGQGSKPPRSVSLFVK
jgi:hypothetical protein